MLIEIKRPELLQRIRELILTKPERFVWNVWITGNMWTTPCELLPGAFLPEKDGEPCGTMACIAGWGTTLLCPAGMKYYDFLKTVDVSVNVEAIIVLRHLLDKPDLDNKSEEYRPMMDFLFVPWEWRDSKGHKMKDFSMSDTWDHNYDSEAIRRIDWLLAGNPIDQYIIPDGFWDEDDYEDYLERQRYDNEPIDLD